MQPAIYVDGDILKVFSFFNALLCLVFPKLFGRREVAAVDLLKILAKVPLIVILLNVKNRFRVKKTVL